MAIVEVVKYNGKPNTMAWKYPSEELGTWTQVIVNETQEVVFVKEGKVLDVLGAGRHTLSTDNIPLLSKLVNLPFGGKSPFTAEIWYINKIYALDVKWGTAPAIQLQDPKYHVFVPVTAFGQFGIQVSDSKKFLTKLVGTLPSFDHDVMVKYFRGLLVSNAKNVISGYLVKKNISILEINAYISEISEELENKLRPEIEKFGIDLVNFYVTSIEAPEDDSAVIKLKEALSKRAEMDIVGYDYGTARSFDTLETAAKNEGSGSNLMNAGIGLGMGFGIGGQFGNQMSNVASKINTNGGTKEKEMSKCKKCGADVEENQKFCPECGAKIGDFCKECGAKLSKKQKYCPECGALQLFVCPSCKKEIDENSKFCPECGEKLGGKNE
ncbi:MAG: SPFH domain-containing protein [Firmicutes bacterium]|nr:SPFH domain-containing protein [Bacillota bacterium]